MRTLMIAAAAATALASAALPAHAAPTRDYAGGCRPFSVSQDTTTGPDRFVGEVNVVVVAKDAAGIPLPTASISVACEVYVNGVLTVVPLSASGIGAAAAAGTFSYDAGPDDLVKFCTRVVVDGEELLDCFGGEPPQPEPPLRPIQDVLFEQLDAMACPTLGGLAPGIPGVVDVTSEGDVTVVGFGLLWDCPPYV